MSARASFGWMAAAVAAASVLPYWSVLPAYFVSDDFNFVRPYLQIDRPVLPFVWDAFTRMRDVPAGFYRPLPFVTLWLEFRTWGTWLPGFHLTNLLVHALVTVLVYAIGRRLSGRRDMGVAAAGTALFYGIHPRRAETVAWLSCRPDLLATLFALGSFWAFLRWNDARRSDVPETGTTRTGHAFAPGTLAGPAWFVVAFVAWWAAIVSKEQALLLPLAYLCVPPAGRPWRARVLPVLPFIASWPAYFVVRRLALGLWVGGYGAGAYTLETVTNPGMWLKHVAYAILPPLEFAHDLIIIPGNYKYFAVLGMAVVATLVALAWRARREPGLLTALVWTLAATLPVIPFHISLTTSFNDRLLYAPAAGVALLLAVSLATFRPRVSATACLAAALVLVPQTVTMAHRWRVAGDSTRQLARSVADQLAMSPQDRPILLAAVPDSYRGAYILRNGLWDAARVAGATSVERVTVLTYYLANDLTHAPVQVTLSGGSVHVRSIGQAEVLLAPTLPNQLIEPDASLPLDRFGQQDVFGRRLEARFRLKMDADVWVLHPTRLERLNPDGAATAP